MVLNEKQKEFIISIIKIVIGILFAGMGGGKYLGKEMEPIQYITVTSVVLLLLVIGIILQKD